MTNKKPHELRTRDFIPLSFNYEERNYSVDNTENWKEYKSNRDLIYAINRNFYLPLIATLSGVTGLAGLIWVAKDLLK